MDHFTYILTTLVVFIVICHGAMCLIGHRPTVWKVVGYLGYLIAIGGLCLADANSRRLQFAESHEFGKRLSEFETRQVIKHARIAIWSYGLGIRSEESKPESRRHQLESYKHAHAWFIDIASQLSDSPNTAELNEIGKMTQRDELDSDETWEEKELMLSMIAKAGEQSAYVDFTTEMVSSTPMEEQFAVAWPILLAGALSIGITKVTADLLGYTTAKTN